MLFSLNPIQQTCKLFRSCLVALVSNTTILNTLLHRWGSWSAPPEVPRRGGSKTYIPEDIVLYISSPVSLIPQIHTKFIGGMRSTYIVRRVICSRTIRGIREHKHRKPGGIQLKVDSDTDCSLLRYTGRCSENHTGENQCQHANQGIPQEVDHCCLRKIDDVG